MYYNPNEIINYTDIQIEDKGKYYNIYYHNEWYCITKDIIKRIMNKSKLNNRIITNFMIKYY